MSTPALATLVHDWVQSHRDDILQNLRALVTIETHNRFYDGGEKPAQIQIAEKLRVLGCETDIYDIDTVPGLLSHPSYWEIRPCTDRPNVMGIRKGQGGGKSLLISSHVDTIGVGPDPWTQDPFGGDVEGDKFFGLGAYDMKSGIAAGLAMLECLNDLDITLRGDLMIESVVDEEQGGGNGTLAARLKYNADFAILPEPTDETLATYHHSALLLRVTLRGKPGIMIGGQRPQNATIDMAKFIVWLDKWQEQRAVRWEADEFHKQTPLPFLISQLESGETQLPLGERVPSHAWMVVLIAAYPHMTEQQVMDDLLASWQEAQAADEALRVLHPEWEVVRWLDGTALPTDHPGVQIFAAAQEKVTGQPARLGGMSAPCDGAIFNRDSSTPVLILGPLGGNAHAPDEYIRIDAYLNLVETFIVGALDWCGVAEENQTGA